MSIRRVAPGVPLVVLLVLLGPRLLAAQVLPAADFPVLGIGLGQMLRVNSVGRQPGPSQTPSAGCDAVLSFTDHLGNPVGPAPLPVSLAPGQAAFLDLPGPARLGRREARPVVRFADAAARTDCAFGVEIFEQASGVSSCSGIPAQSRRRVRRPRSR